MFVVGGGVGGEDFLESKVLNEKTFSFKTSQPVLQVTPLWIPRITYSNV